MKTNLDLRRCSYEEMDAYSQNATLETVSFRHMSAEEFFWFLVYPAQSDDELDALVTIALRDRTDAGFRRMLRAAHHELASTDPKHPDAVRLMKCILRVTEGWQKRRPSAPGLKIDFKPTRKPGG